MAVGVSISVFFQLAMMAYFVRRHKIMFHWQHPKLGDKTKQLFKLMGPGVLSAGVFQINLFVDMIVASLLPAGAISFYIYALIASINFP